MTRNIFGNLNFESKTFFLTVTFLSVTLVMCAILDLYVAKAIVGFLYLTFIPGMVLIRLLKIRSLSLIKNILFSAGFSIAFLMPFGLLINFIGPIFNLEAPLSAASLLVTIPLVVEAMAVLSLFSGPEKSGEEHRFVFSKKNRTKIVLASLFACLPVLSVIGVFAVNVYGNNSILLVLIAFAAGLVGTVCVYPKLSSDTFYGFALCMLAIALLLHTSLISNYVYGGDTHMEYQLFSITKNASHWNPTVATTDLGYNWLNAMLSITILPTVYSNILGIDGTWVFKVVFPLVFSFVCLGLYLLYRKEFEPRVAFVSVFFFMANSVFFVDVSANIRQMVAELFYVLLFLVLLDDRLEKRTKGLVFPLFAAALIFSHYATSYLFLFMIAAMWCYALFLKKNRKVSGRTVAIFSVIMFSWYIYVSNSGPFKGLLSTIEWLRGSFVNQFLNFESRGTTVLEGVGLSGISTFWHLVGRGVFYLTELLIIVGFLYLILTRKKRIVSNEYLTLVFLNVAILAACLIIPSFANTLNMTRFYHLVLFFLAPLLVIGSLQILHIIKRNLKTEIGVALIMFVLIPFFLFQTGFAYEITKEESYSIPLSKDRMGLVPYVQMSMIRDYEVYGATWLSSFVNSETAKYADTGTSGALVSRALIFGNTIRGLTNVTIVGENSVVFLSSVNVIDGTIGSWNTSQMSYVFDGLSLVYSNDGCNIYSK